MLANAGFLPTEVVGLGGCNAVSRAASLFSFLPPVPAERVTLASLVYSTGGDVAVLGARTVGFGLVVGFVTEPVPPGNPSFAGAVAAVLRASDIVARALWGFSGDRR